MKISVLTVSNNELVATKKNDSLALISSYLYKNGFDVESTSTIKVDFDKIVSKLTIDLENSECIILTCDDQIDTSFVTKKAISKVVEQEIVTNSYAKNNITAYYKAFNLPPTKESNSYAFMPNMARCITNEYGPMQGFLINKDNKLIIFMPQESLQLKQMFISSVLPFLLEQSKKLNNTYIFKTYGLTSQEMLSILKDLRKNKQKVEILCNEKLLEGEIIINYPQKLDSVVVDGFVSTVYKRLSNYIYAETDVSIEERVRDLLNINSLTLSTAEDYTLGNITSSFLTKNFDGNKYLIESYVVPSDSSKTTVLGVDQDLLNTKSSPDDIAYQMATGALENSGSDFVLSTYGEGDTCYIGIGTMKGIYVYKEIVSGSTEERVKKATSAAIFHLIKKIKKNDFHLSQTTV